jgi:serine protease Do
VVVTEVDPASPAGEKVIKAGDVVIEIGQEPVTSIDDVTKGIAVRLRLQDGQGDARFVALPVR